MRVAVLWTHLSGYMNACVKELASREGVEIFVCRSVADSSAPFDERQFDWMKNSLTWSSCKDLDSLAERLRAFAPDILIMAGWAVPAYRKVAREFANKCWRVMTMDNGWRGTLKQYAGRWSAPFFLHPLADSVWLPGERQAVFARKCGFRQSAILRGVYACDQPALEAGYLARVSEGRPVPRAFLFVGRFISDKGIGLLAEAYRNYRERAANPWPLVCCGTGPLQSLLEGNAGIRIEGFVQPDRMPEVFASAGCLILPSRFEPWALVVHEATSAGLMILASEKVGAVAHLVQPNYNGFIFDPRHAEELTSLMCRVGSLSDASLEALSRGSHHLSQQFSPRRWTDTLLDAYAALPRSPGPRSATQPQEQNTTA